MKYESYANGGSKPVGPLYHLRPGQSVVVTGGYERIKSAVCYVRKTCGWTLRQRKVDGGIEVCRDA